MTEYNGWRNRETWCVALHLQNTSREVYDAARQIAREGGIAGLRHWVTADVSLPVLVSDLVAGKPSRLRLAGAYALVDWQEVVEALLEE